jgi:hypothetical protein
MGLDLIDCFERNTDNDNQACTTKLKWNPNGLNDYRRNDADSRKVNRTAHGQT